MKFNKLLHYANIPYHLANHVVGEHHTPVHRKAFGFAVMGIGVAIAHSSAHIPNILLSLLGDLIGYSFHGAGLLPFIHDLEHIKNQKTKNNHCENPELCK